MFQGVIGAFLSVSGTGGGLGGLNDVLGVPGSFLSDSDDTVEVSRGSQGRLRESLSERPLRLLKSNPCTGKAVREVLQTFLDKKLRNLLHMKLR